jgi:hypothetical protein
MKKGITFVGMDAHKVAIKLAVLLPGETKPVEWQLSNEKAGPCQDSWIERQCHAGRAHAARARRA